MWQRRAASTSTGSDLCPVLSLTTVISGLDHCSSLLAARLFLNQKSLLSSILYRIETARTPHDLAFPVWTCLCPLTPPSGLSLVLTLNPGLPPSLTLWHSQCCHSHAWHGRLPPPRSQPLVSAAETLPQTHCPSLP